MRDARCAMRDMQCQTPDAGCRMPDKKYGASRGEKLLTCFFAILFLFIHSFVFSQDQASGIRHQASGTQDPESHSEAETTPWRGGIGHPGNWVLVIHGGAGGPPRGTMPEEKEQQYREKLSEALSVGSEILQQGGSSMDAVEAVVRFMEDCPLFNAGKGAVYNDEGVAEMDASIMDGSTLMAGAVTGVSTIRHPVSAARLVMTDTKHLLLMGEGAEQFAKEKGLEIMDPSWFKTPERTEQYERMKQSEGGKKVKIEGKGHQDTVPVSQTDDQAKGTVGAVALDNMGNLAAATSTGGLMMKMRGRIGDTPIIGAGTYANNATCAVSCTGTGEYFMRDLIAYDVSALMEYRGWPLEQAARYEIDERLKAQGGSGGLIAVDREGNVAMPFNTNAMFRGYAKAKEGSTVEI